MIGIDMAKSLPNYKADFNKEAFREKKRDGVNLFLIAFTKGLEVMVLY